MIGALSDRIGRKPVLIAFGVLGTFGNMPLMTAISKTHGSVHGNGCLILLALVVISCYTALSAVVKAELLPRRDPLHRRRVCRQRSPSRSSVARPTLVALLVQEPSASRACSTGT